TSASASSIPLLSVAKVIRLPNPENEKSCPVIDLLGLMPGKCAGTFRSSPVWGARGAVNPCVTMFVYVDRQIALSEWIMSGGLKSQQDVDIDLGGLFGAIWRHRMRVLLATVACAGVAFVGASMISPTYKSEARLLIETREPAFTTGTDRA